MGLLVLYFEFFKIGLFAIGGGLATLPFLFQLSDKYDWFTHEMVSDMIAISESTPGPIGINMATYVGFQNYGVIGGITATVGIITPSIIIIIIIAKFLKRFADNPIVEQVFFTLRPAVTGMLGAVALTLATGEILNKDVFNISGSLAEVFKYKEIILFAVLIFLTNKFKKHPLFYIGSAMVIGIVFKF